MHFLDVLIIHGTIANGKNPHNLLIMSYRMENVVETSDILFVSEQTVRVFANCSSREQQRSIGSGSGHWSIFGL